MSDMNALADDLEYWIRKPEFKDSPEFPGGWSDRQRQIRSAIDALRAMGWRPICERVVDEIAAERKRQIADENWTAEHDDSHTSGELARAAGCYALHAGGMTEMGCDRPGDLSDDDRWSMPQHWPWDCEWWKPKNPRRDLIRAAALIVAEIERIDRALPAAPEAKP